MSFPQTPIYNVSRARYWLFIMSSQSGVCFAIELDFYVDIYWAYEINTLPRVFKAITHHL